jgi:hypothetical protein
LPFPNNHPLTSQAIKTAISSSLKSLVIRFNLALQFLSTKKGFSAKPKKLLKENDRSVFYLFSLGDILSTFTIALLTPAKGGNRCDSVCSAVHRLTIPLELVSNQPSLSL